MGASCAVIPEETAGPFPGDGSNGPDILSQSGVVRQDIRSSFGTSTTVAEGIPLTIKLTIQDTAENCAPLAGAAVYAWHCDRDGQYSMYSQAVANENYLRGVQAAGDDGVVTFTSIFPGCYSGRWPHIHFEVYPSLDTATTVDNKIATSQIALPKDASRAGLRDRRLRAERPQPGPAQPRERQRLRRGRRRPSARDDHRLASRRASRSAWPCPVSG